MVCSDGGNLQAEWAIRIVNSDMTWSIGECVDGQSDPVVSQAYTSAQ